MEDDGFPAFELRSGSMASAPEVPPPTPRAGADGPGAVSAPGATIFVADDDALVLFFVRGVLRTAGYRVEVFEQPERIVARLSASDRGCVVLDLLMPALSGLDVQRMLLERGVPLPLIFMSGHADVPAAVAAMKRGAIDFLTKPIAPDELLRVVGRALRRDAEAAARREARRQARARWQLLSARERSVCRLVEKGLVDKQVAAELGIALATAHAQRTAAFKKLGIGLVVELIRLLDLLDEGD